MRFSALCRRAALAAILLQAAVVIAAPAQASRPAGTASHPARSSAPAHAAPSTSLKSCMDRAGMSPVERDRCMRQHCDGRWGKGDCPASGGNFLSNKGASPNSPLSRCLNEAGMNPFKRDACGWKYCRKDNTPECAPFKGKAPPQQPR
ncbi:MAG: hypothetical protein LBI48_08945 [Burkholderiaceae bacterium]|jgi:hypothetical protein|nr:hypothetical protein [Burkholderiaceae bacterium]